MGLYKELSKIATGSFCYKNIRLNVKFEDALNPIAVKWLVGKKESRTYKDLLVSQHDEGEEVIYFLPYELNNIKSIKIPTKEIRTNVFLTASLTSCFIGIKPVKDEIEVLHINILEPSIGTVLSDLRRHEGYYWVVPISLFCSIDGFCINDNPKISQQALPEGYAQVQGDFFVPDNSLGSISYYHGTSSFHASFFGLFEDGKWNFYLQDYTDYQCNKLKITPIDFDY